MLPVSFLQSLSFLPMSGSPDSMSCKESSLQLLLMVKAGIASMDTGLIDLLLEEWLTAWWTAWHYTSPLHLFITYL